MAGRQPPNTSASWHWIGFTREARGRTSCLPLDPAGWGRAVPRLPCCSSAGARAVPAGCAMIGQTGEGPSLRCVPPLRNGKHQVRGEFSHPNALAGKYFRLNTSNWHIWPWVHASAVPPLAGARIVRPSAGVCFSTPTWGTLTTCMVPVPSRCAPACAQPCDSAGSSMRGSRCVQISEGHGTHHAAALLVATRGCGPCAPVEQLPWHSLQSLRRPAACRDADSRTKPALV
jgi:hypothetical protein